MYPSSSFLSFSLISFPPKYHAAFLHDITHNPSICVYATTTITINVTSNGPPLRAGTELEKITIFLKKSKKSDFFYLNRIFLI